MGDACNTVLSDYS